MLQQLNEVGEWLIRMDMRVVAARLPMRTYDGAILDWQRWSHTWNLDALQFAFGETMRVRGGRASAMGGCVRDACSWCVLRAWSGCSICRY